MTNYRTAASHPENFPTDDEPTDPRVELTDAMDATSALVYRLYELADAAAAAGEVHLPDTLRAAANAGDELFRRLRDARGMAGFGR